MLRYVPPTQVFDLWPWINNGIQHCVQKGGGHYGPAEVMLMLARQDAGLYVLEYDGDDIGFAVLRSEHDPDGHVMFVFALWTEPGEGKRFERQIYDELEALARSTGARRIRMQSKRRGYGRLPFFHPVGTVYEWEL